MPRLKHQTPKYFLHKASGQAVVKIDGRCRYLGKYGSPRSKARSEAELARWKAAQGSPALQTCIEQVPNDDLRVGGLL